MWSASVCAADYTFRCVPRFVTTLLWRRVLVAYWTTPLRSCTLLFFQCETVDYLGVYFMTIAQKWWVSGVYAAVVLTPVAHAQSALELGTWRDVSQFCGAGACEESLLDTPNLAQPQQGRVIEVPSNGIEAYMPIATEAQGLPETIQGIWWMDGNPLGDILVTLGSSHYDPATRTAFLTTGDEGSYSFRKSAMTRSAYEHALKDGQGYVMQFDETFQHATITPSLLKNGKRQLISTKIVRFEMHYAGDGHWIRQSWVFGIRIPDYNLRRVVRADGTRDPAYTGYLKSAGVYSYLLSHF